VSPEQKSRLESLAAAGRNQLFGIPVKFRQQEMRACVAPVSISFELEPGGFRQGGEFAMRFLASTLDSAPRKSEPVAFAGRSYLINQVGEVINNPAEYTCIVTPAGGGQ
jgi:hypothetical protein